MRAGLENWFNEIWYGSRSPPAWLQALKPVYGLAARLDRILKTRARKDFPDGACIVVVGNLTVGGSGKTPLVIRLCRVFTDAGMRPGVVSRGYGRGSKGLQEVGPDSDVAQVGDEAVLLSRSGCPVVVAEDRYAAALHLLEKGCNVILCDDGLQHHRLPRDIEICVIDGRRGFGNGQLLPAGPLREPLERLSRVDHVIINGSMTDPPGGAEVQRMELVTGLLRELDGDASWRLSQYRGCRVNAVAGIGNPDRFFDTLRQAGVKVVEHRYPDHHSYRESDFSGLEPELPVIMTEKDAVKCAGIGLRNAWYLNVEASLPAAWEARLIEQVYHCWENTG
jgi:tetraacyldisaccharide 4'-kinase